ncbi:3-hydroxyacyl-CoA dehydrogenase NAD-binding domain-containing protein [Lentibacillus sp. N15]|uniref:3-hydroxyacyl-CoA dehydrogenase NAD-binding domain-containing protein n=1 Tax=Lentibacillus songyuanensis TaxID=3136161 RepID=UPI0031BB460F
MVPEINNVSVVGAGTMGSGIAQLFLQGNVNVTMIDASESALTRGRQKIIGQLEQLSQYGLFDQNMISETMEHLTLSTRISNVSTADIVIEAVPEKLSLKQDVFKEIESYCSRETLISTNTSGLSINQIVCALEHPERAIGTHFFMPADVIPLVEVIKSEYTSSSTTNRIMAILKKVNKKPVLIHKDIPGFIANRIQHALMREALYLAESGVASAEDIDTVVRYSLGVRLLFTGPLEQRDLNGLDIHYDIANYLYGNLENRSSPSDLLTSKVENNELGIKTGKGFYEWDEEPEAVLQRKNAQLYELMHWLEK